MLVYICKSDGKSYYTYFGRRESLYVFYKTLQTYAIYALLSDIKDYFAKNQIIKWCIAAPLNLLKS